MAAGDVSVSFPKVYRVSPNDGTVSGGVTIEDGAMKFDGVDGRVVGTAHNFIKNTAFSFSTWVYLDNTINKDSVIFSNHYNATEQWTIRYTNASGYVDGAFYRSAGGSIYEGRFGGAVSKGQWLYLTTVYNGSTLNQGTDGVKFYINGILQAGSSGNAGGALGSAGTFTMASRNDGVAYLNGSIDDALIFNRALSQDEITQLYNQGRGKYSSVTDGLVAQYSGRDFAGTEASPTKIYDTKNVDPRKEDTSFIDTTIAEARVTANDKFLMVPGHRGQVYVTHIEEAP